MNSEQAEHSDNDGMSEGTSDSQQASPAELSGFTPEEQHRAGMIALLNQLFRDASINPSNLTDLVIENKLGTVVILEDDEDSEEGVFAITAAINFQTHEKAECLTDLKNFLVKKIQHHGTTDDLEFAKKIILADSPNPTTFLVNEKMVNLPPQFTIVPLETLEDEIGTNNPAGVEEIIICILKLYKKASEENLCYMHAEEKVIGDLATRCVDYPVSIEEFGSILVPAASEEEESEDCPPFRRICFMPTQVFRTTCMPALKAMIEGMQSTQ